MTAAAKASGEKRRARRGKLTRADYERLAEFRYVLRRFLVFSEKAAEGAGLTAQQHQALLAIKAHPESQSMPTGMLAERLAIRHHSAVGLIDRLIRKNLIRRRSATTDRRRVLIELTARAERVLQGLTVAHRDEIERLAPLLRELLAPFEARPD